MVVEEEGTSRKRFHRTSKACTTCRQKKLKCNALEKYPNRCDRCQKNNTVCEIDAAYKKVDSPISVASPFQADKAEDYVKVNYDVPSADKPGHSYLVDQPVMEEEKLFSGVVIPAKTMQDLVKMFYDDFYEHLPVFPREYLDYNHLTGDKRVILWAMCTVVSPCVCPEYTEDLYAHAFNQLHTVSIQTNFMTNPQEILPRIMAVLILCYWRLPRKPPRPDSSWVMLGMAAHWAMHIGLHRLSSHSDFTGNEALYNYGVLASLIWSALLIVTQQLGCLNGLPCTLVFNQRTYRILGQIDPSSRVLARFIARLKIAIVLKNGMNKLGNTSDTEFGVVDARARGLLHSAIIDQLSMTVNTMEISEDDELTEMFFLAAKLEIHSFLLLPDSLLKDQQAVAVPIYLAATKAIDLSIQVASRTDYYMSFPLLYQRISLLGAVILFGLLLSPLHRTLIDVDASHNSISKVYQLCVAMTASKDDVFSKVIAMVECFRRLEQAHTLKQPVFNVKSRLGASGFISALSLVKDELQSQEMNHLATNDCTAPGVHVQSDLDSLLNDLWGWKDFPL